MQKKRVTKTITNEREFIEVKTTLHEVMKKGNVTFEFTHGNLHYEFDNDHPEDMLEVVHVRVNGKWEPIAPADIRLTTLVSTQDEGWY